MVLGDGGKGNANQRLVAEGIAAVCADRTDNRAAGCAFALYLGDNVYDTGVESADDPQFHSKFEQPYAGLDFPFFVVMGNHDYGSTSLARWRAEPQVAYTARSEKWTLPAPYYTFAVGNVQFYGLDTNALMLESIWGDSGQGAWLDDQLDGPRDQWRVVFGHHPYRSNGQHGNAGAYEGLGWLPVVRGSTVADFYEDHVCGRVDIAFAGHDHNRQWLSPTCRTHFVVSGAASHVTPLARRDANPTEFEDDSEEGFLWVEIDGDALTGVFYDADGTERFVRTVARSGTRGWPASQAMDANHSGMRRSSQ